jgi:hypothetical protein
MRVVTKAEQVGLVRLTDEFRTIMAQMSIIDSKRESLWHGRPMVVAFDHVGVLDYVV